MPSIVRRPDLRKVWAWLFLGLIVVFALCVSYPVLRKQAGDFGSAESRIAATEQSLAVLDALPQSTAAPGEPLAQAGAGDSAQADSSAMQSSAGGAPAEGLSSASCSSGETVCGGEASAASSGSSASGAQSASGSSGAGTLAAALADVAKSEKRPGSKGWGGETARTGFTPPRANFGGLSGLGATSQGGGSSGAGYSSGLSAFGTGRSNPGQTTTAELQGGPPSSAAPRPRPGSIQSFDALKNARALASQAAWNADAERAAGLSAKTYDASAVRQTIGGGAGGGGGAGVSMGAGGVARDLKPNNPNLQLKEVQPPIPDPKKTGKDDMLGMQMTMMFMQMMMGGILGPLMSGLFGPGGGPQG